MNHTSIQARRIARKHKLSALRNMARSATLPTHLTPNLTKKSLLRDNGTIIPDNHYHERSILKKMTGNFETRRSVSSLLTHLTQYRREKNLRKTMSAETIQQEKTINHRMNYLDKPIYMDSKFVECTSDLNPHHHLVLARTTRAIEESRMRRLARYHEMEQWEKFQFENPCDNIETMNYKCGIRESTLDLIREYKLRSQNSYSVDSRRFTRAKKTPKYFSEREKWRSIERRMYLETKLKNKKLSGENSLLKLRTERLPIMKKYEEKPVAEYIRLGQKYQTKGLPDCPDMSTSEGKAKVQTQPSLTVQSQESLAQSVKTEKRVTINESLNSTLYYDKSSSTSNSQNEENKTPESILAEIPNIHVIEKNRCKSKAEKNCKYRVEKRRCKSNIEEKKRSSYTRRVSLQKPKLREKSPYTICELREKSMNTPFSSKRYSYKPKEVIYESDSIHSIFLLNPDVDVGSLIECASQKERSASPSANVPSMPTQQKKWSCLWNPMMQKYKKIEPMLKRRKQVNLTSDKEKLHVVEKAVQTHDVVEKSIQTRRKSSEQGEKLATTVGKAKMNQTNVENEVQLHKAVKKNSDVNAELKASNEKVNKLGFFTQLAACLLCDAGFTKNKREKKQIKITIRRKEKKRARSHMCPCRYCRNKTLRMPQTQQTINQTGPSSFYTGSPETYKSKPSPINAPEEVFLMDSKLNLSQQQNKRQCERYERQSSEIKKSKEKIIKIESSIKHRSIEEDDSILNDITPRTLKETNSDLILYKNSYSEITKPQISRDLFFKRPLECPDTSYWDIQKVNITRRYDDLCKKPG